ncbi:DNA gyrase/topoisomerase IV subunit A [Planctopirus hydrillae]|uniref:DNA topoisomerase (ATP-hydrolyzing) n=1 Tax=Planctopirus hydrillae TaxID=1841610 RepID=A0A1C3ENC6_9PLAN|nr:DNA topoisomerase (ATP-hydrolyzing) [Planctopirus hydrillae]ODA34731.1 DNA topoisomerase [Planctopirus hydrillae]
MTENQEDRIQFREISSETRRRYLNYAMSVIQSRALPDVRDGLKPVQRRILYVMYEELRLMADAKTRKCAKISGDTTGNYHPHGNQSVYDTLVRLAQDFTLRYPLVDGQGNFGSIMGLPAAAERYTEARLTGIAEQLMNELRFDTVEMRPNYDGTRKEPVVLPTRFPNLLVNGTAGIAVGMATNMPPHNLKEVLDACIHLITNPEASTKELLKFIKGPDFPLGGRMITDRKAMLPIYEEGRGAFKVRAEWRMDKEKRAEVEDRVVIYSVPYGVETGPLLAEIGNVIASRKLPQLINAADETDDKHGLRVVLELKKGSDPESVMAFLYKKTPLEQNFNYNSTVLIPDDQGLLTPARLPLHRLLGEFLKFRLKVVKKRFQFQLDQLQARIHILRGLEIIFNGIDKAIKIIRNSNGKRDACDKLMAAFPLDEPQTMAILEMQLYRISQLEIDTVLAELNTKQKEADRITRILAKDDRIWNVIEGELRELSEQFGDKRRTTLGSSDEVTEFDESHYIVRENTNVVLSKDGWIKRVGRLQSVESTRVREGDQVLDVLPGSTVDHVIFFASDGIAYTMPISQVPVSSGYGEPLTKHYKFKDGVQVIAAVTTDPRFTAVAEETAEGAEPAPPHLFVTTAQGQVMRVPLQPFRTASTRSGRKFCKLQEGDVVAKVELIVDQTSVFLVTREARLIHFSLDEIPVLSGAGKGVRGIRLEEKEKDLVLGAALMSRPSDVLRLKLANEKELTCGQMKYALTTRGGKGVKVSHRSQVAEIVRPEIALVDWNSIES